MSESTGVVQQRAPAVVIDFGECPPLPPPKFVQPPAFSRFSFGRR